MLGRIHNTSASFNHRSFTVCMVIDSCFDSSFISSIGIKRFSFIGLFSFGNNKESQVAKCSEHGSSGIYSFFETDFAGTLFKLKTSEKMVRITWYANNFCNFLYIESTIFWNLSLSLSVFSCLLKLLELLEHL